MTLPPITSAITTLLLRRRQSSLTQKVFAFKHQDAFFKEVLATLKTSLTNLQKRAFSLLHWLFFDHTNYSSKPLLHYAIHNTNYRFHR